jgi:ribose 5-phosphate isomerase B
MSAIGRHELDEVDYGDYAVVVARAVAGEEYKRGFLVCGTGQGMAISANKITGVRAAICHATFSVRMSQLHNGANVLCMGDRVVGSGLAAHIVET